ncbi:threonine--tRNA ligase [Clostridium sp.]|uniref:threonine--tRNA ligase n=1 Tax=Clostridium sp. TaxID=1506 RepID=UPI003D6CE8CB
MINITLKDGSMKSYESGMTVLEIAKDISEGLARVACAGMVNGKTVDLRHEVTEDCELSILTFDDEEGKKAFRHTACHILAQAVKRLFPATKLAIGPAIDGGFYYDFDKQGSFSAEEIIQIEAEMKKIVKEDLPIERYELPRAEAISFMLGKDENFKVQLIEDLPEDVAISFYKQGEYTDLCAGPHLMSTKPVKAFKLTQVAGAYWRGDEKNKMLSRIYGTAFTKKSDLDDHIERVEDAKKRDHNKLGRELKFFTTSDVIGQGLPLLMPNGARVIQLLQRFVEDEEERRGYVITKTPLMAKSDLYKMSGHWDHYKDGMFILGDESKDEEVMALRPMTCPFQFTIYNADQKSYRDLPIRYAETSTLFRNESSGEMHGLIRVRQFTISEGHLVVRPDQLEDEFKGVINLINYIMVTLGLENDITYRFSKGDPNNKEKYIDNPAAWEDTEAKMKVILDHLGINYKTAIDEAAFYGPKLDLQIKNVHGKEDTIITVQIDFALPERFDMTYIDKDGVKKRPYVIHRTSIGCYERTLAILIEKYAGAFPTWLAPLQVKVLPISEKFHDYADTVIAKLKAANIRTSGDFRAEKIGYKIREARNERAPFLLIVGEKEADLNEVSVRSRRNGDEGSIALDSFIARIKEEIETRLL